MSSNAFTGGIKPGGLTNDFEVKILICYLLDNVSQPLTFEQICEIIQDGDFVNYFEFTDAMSELQDTGHIIVQRGENNKKFYEITEIGVATSKTFSKTLPLTVREKTLNLAKNNIQYNKRKEQIYVSYKKVSDGYNLTLQFKDIGTDLLNMNIFIPTEKQCEEIKNHIYQNPALIYGGILYLILGEYSDLINLSSEQIVKGNEAKNKDGQIF